LEKKRNSSLTIRLSSFVFIFSFPQKTIITLILCQGPLVFSIRASIFLLEPFYSEIPATLQGWFGHDSF
jgi:hypothetical protein